MPFSDFISSYWFCFTDYRESFLLFDHLRYDHFYYSSNILPKSFRRCPFFSIGYFLISLWCKALTHILLYMALKVSLFIPFSKIFLHTFWKILVSGLWHVFNKQSCCYLTGDTFVPFLFYGNSFSLFFCIRSFLQETRLLSLLIDG